MTRGIETPACAYAHCMRPEQSKPVCGDAPPQWYGVPRYCAAIRMALSAVGEAAWASMTGTPGRDVDTGPATSAAGTAGAAPAAASATPEHPRPERGRPGLGEQRACLVEP